MLDVLYNGNRSAKYTLIKNLQNAVNQHLQFVLGYIGLGSWANEKNICFLVGIPNPLASTSKWGGNLFICFPALFWVDVIFIPSLDIASFVSKTHT